MWTFPERHDIRSRLVLLWTFTCLCQSESRCWKADPTNCEAEARLAHDTSLLDDKGTKSRKDVGYLDGTARKRQSKRCSSQLHKTRIRLHSWQMYRRWSTQRISTLRWMGRRRSESLKCIGFQGRHLPSQQGGKRPEFLAVRSRKRFVICLSCYLDEGFVLVQVDLIHSLRDLGNAQERTLHKTDLSQQQERGKAKDVLRNYTRHAENLKNGWIEETMKVWDVLGCHDHTDHVIKEDRERCRQIYAPKQKTLAYTRD